MLWRRAPSNASFPFLPRPFSTGPGGRRAHGLGVGEGEAGQGLLVELVAVAEQLVAAADGKQDGAALGRGGEVGALAGDHVGGDHALVAVLATADVEEVVGGGIDVVTGPGAGVGEADPAPFAAALQEDDVAAVGVDVHLLRVEAEQAELHLSLPSRRGRRSSRRAGRWERSGAGAGD